MLFKLRFVFKVLSLCDCIILFFFFLVPGWRAGRGCRGCCAARWPGLAALLCARPDCSARSASKCPVVDVRAKERRREDGEGGDEVGDHGFILASCFATRRRGHMKICNAVSNNGSVEHALDIHFTIASSCSSSSSSSSFLFIQLKLNEA